MSLVFVSLWVHLITDFIKTDFMLNIIHQEINLANEPDEEF